MTLLTLFFVAGLVRAQAVPSESCQYLGLWFLTHDTRIYDYSCGLTPPHP